MVHVVAGFVLLLAAAATTPVGAAAGARSVTTFSNPEALGRYLQGRLMEERGDLDQALSEYFRTLVLDPKAAEVARRVSEVSARVGETERSLEFADRSLSLEPGDSRSQWLKASALFNLGRAAEALPVMQAATAADSDNAQYLRTLAHVAEQVDRVDLVAWSCSRSVAIDEEDGEAWFQLASARARLQDLEGAEKALDRAAAINPVRPGLLFLRGWIMEGLGRIGEAIDSFRHHLEVHADDQVTRRRLANLFARQSRYAEAFHEAGIISRSSPADFDALEVEADMGFRAGRAADALKVLERLKRMGQADPDLMARVISLAARNHRGPEGVAMAERWRLDHAGDCRGPLLVARARMLAEDSKGAIEWARRAVDACPDSLMPRVVLARLYQGGQRLAEAEKVWAETVRKFPNHLAVSLDLAYCREQLGDLGGAQQAARDVLESHPDDPTALNFLGYLLADHNRDLDEAATLIGRAVSQEPDNGAFMDSFGWVHYRLGRLAEARQELEKAVRLTGGDPVVHEHLGDVYKGLKLLDLARDQYQKSLAGDASNRRVKAKLAEIH